MVDAGATGSLWTSAEFIAAILGAIVGGSIPLAGQFLSDQRSSKRREHATSIGLFFKLMGMHASLHQIRVHLQDGASLAKIEGIGPSATTAPLANSPLPVSISIDEKAVALSFNDPDLLNEVPNLDRTYNSMIVLNERYVQLRSSVSDVIRGIPDHMGRVTADLTREQYAQVAGTRFEMDQILASWLDFTHLDEHTSLAALKTLALHIRRLYNAHFQLGEIEFPKRGKSIPPMHKG